MRQIRVYSDGRYTHHGIGHTEHDGYSGTMDNRMPLGRAVIIEERKIEIGETFEVVVNEKSKGVFTKHA